MAETEPLNPYQAPESSPDEPNVSPGPRFRFRVIPACLVGIYGGIALLGASISPAALAIMLWLAPNERRPEPLALFAIFLGWIVMVIAGLVGLAAAREFMRGRWWRAVGLTVAMYALIYLPAGIVSLASAWFGFR